MTCLHLNIDGLFCRDCGRQMGHINPPKSGWARRQQQQRLVIERNKEIAEKHSQKRNGSGND